MSVAERDYDGSESISISETTIISSRNSKLFSMEEFLEVLKGARRKVLGKKLARIMGRIEEGELPMFVEEVYLFGSFLTEKTSPQDLDILLIYDSNRTAERYTEVEPDGEEHWNMEELRRAPSRLRDCLKEDGEQIDICICPNLDMYQKDLEYRMTNYLRIWSRDDRDWKDKLVRHFREI